MKSTRKIWLGIGAFVVAGTGGISVGAPALVHSPTVVQRTPVGLASDAAVGYVRRQLAQHTEHGKEDGEGGESKSLADLPTDLAFGVRVALLRGHLLVGDELVRQRQWVAALPHFLHPAEELYDDIKGELNDYKVPPFDDALEALVGVVKAKKGGTDYAKALKLVAGALDAANEGMKRKHPDWVGFVVESAVEAIKTAGGEYKNAIMGGKLAKPVEYQDARGFIWQAERMIASVAAAAEKKDAASIKAVRTGIVELKKVFPAAMPPKAPVKDHAAVLAIITRIELAAAKLM